MRTLFFCSRVSVGRAVCCSQTVILYASHSEAATETASSGMEGQE